MGAVYEAVHDATGAHYALKTLLPNLVGNAARADLDRFRREAEAMGKLNHPNVVRIHAADLGADTPYLVQDLLVGGTLQDRIKAGPLEINDAIHIARQLGHGLQHCHEHGVLHRDLKPSNVLFSERGDPLLVDFGLAHTLEASQRLTATGSVMGTPSYMAPEQATGSLDVDARTDVYGLAAVLHHCLTGEAPFPRANVLATLNAVTRTPAAPPSDTRPSVPPWLDAIVLRAMAKKPRDRYQSVEAFVDALDAGGGASASTSWLARRLPTLAACVILGSAALVLFGSKSPTKERPLPAPAASPVTPPKSVAPEAPVTAETESKRIGDLQSPRARIAGYQAWLARFQGSKLRRQVEKRLKHETSRPLKTLRHGAAVFTKAAFLDDGTLVTLSLEGELVTWDIETGKALTRTRQFAPDPERGWVHLEALGSKFGLAYGGEHQPLTWLRDETALTEEDVYVSNMTLSPDRQTLAVCRRTRRETAFFAVETTERLMTLEHAGNRGFVVAYSPDGTRVAICTGSVGDEAPVASRLQVFEVPTGTLLVDSKTIWLGRALRFLTNTSLLLGNNFGEIQLWDLEAL
jgi:hypothetical protein